MDQSCFWLSDEQFSRLEPLLPTDTRGKPRVDDRRVISGIIHVLISGCRWKDAPAIMFHGLAGAGGPPAELLIDSSAVKAHRCASGGKGGSAARRSAGHAADGRQRSTP